MSRTIWKHAVVFLFVSSISLHGVSQQIAFPDWDGSVVFDLIASQEPVRPGDRLELAVVVEIENGYHLYGPEERKPSRTEIYLHAQHLRAEKPVFPPVVRRDLSGLGEYDLYEGMLSIRIPVTSLDAAAEISEIPVRVEIKYQVCTDSACSPPNSKVLSLSLPTADKGFPVKQLRRDVFAAKDPP
jgi:hypothetical protein